MIEQTLANHLPPGETEETVREKFWALFNKHYAGNVRSDSEFTKLGGKAKLGEAYRANYNGVEAYLVHNDPNSAIARLNQRGLRVNLIRNEIGMPYVLDEFDRAVTIVTFQK